MTLAFAVALFALGIGGKAAAEPYNLVCSGTNNWTVTLTIRDSWSPYLSPSIRAETGRVGETVPVSIIVYTADKIQVEVPIEIDNHGRKLNGTITITIDRNTAAAEFDMTGNWQTTKDGTRYRENFDKWSGQCQKELPKL